MIRSNIATRMAACLAILLSAGQSMLGQTTTSTNCTINGNTAQCTSNTTDNAAQQQRAYEQGKQVGQALGQGISGAMQAHAFTKGLKKYCAAHPGEDWHYYSRADGHVLSSGHCPSDEDKAVAAANEFMARHSDYKPCPENSEALITYIEKNNLDPRNEKSYERAYSELKKNGGLELYSK